MGCAGPLDPASATVSPVNIPSLHQFPLADHIAGTLRTAGVPRGLAVQLASDGASAAAGEHWLGAARGVDNALVMVVSTGVGGGLIQAGTLVPGRTGNAGHIGHAIVDLDGEPCVCGSTGCVEAYASGPSITRWAIGQGWRPGEHGQTAADVAADARAGHPIADQAFQRAARALAAGIVSTAAIADIDYVVIGGGVANAHDLLLPKLDSELQQLAHLSFLRGIQVRTALLGDTAGLLGAAAAIHKPDTYKAASVITAHL